MFEYFYVPLKNGEEIEMPIYESCDYDGSTFRVDDESEEYDIAINDGYTDMEIHDLMIEHFDDCAD